MKQVFKFPIQITDEQTITGPITQPVSVGIDPTGQHCVWAECDAEGPTVAYVVTVVGTGHPLPVFAGIYLGMVVDGSFVWHIYIKPA